jgi:steroid 5-alpha reductase family enzyme
VNLAGLLANLGITAGAVLVVMLVALGVAAARGRHDGVDTVWGLGFAVIAVVGLIVSGSGWLVTALTVIWGVRLAVYLQLRNGRRPEDPRYVALMKRATGNPHWYAFRKIYLVQGVIMWFVSWPVQAAQYETAGFGPLAWLGVAVWLVGIAFESVGDWQLARFKADPANKGKVMDRGLWRYTRHPNYFGDSCVWWGLYLVACQHWLGALTVLSPLVMTFFLTRGTGKALTERAMGSRPGYAEYVQRTSGFFPLPPKPEVTR